MKKPLAITLLILKRGVVTCGILFGVLVVWYVLSSLLAIGFFSRCTPKNPIGMREEDLERCLYLYSKHSCDDYVVFKENEKCVEYRFIWTSSFSYIYGESGAVRVLPPDML